MKPPTIRTTENSKKLDERQYLTSWKEIAEYMRCGVRTVQRYEREFGLPVRRPTGKSRGSVMATRAEIDAWVAADPIRGNFRLMRVEQNSRFRKQTNKIERGIDVMRKLNDQMRDLRIETRTALDILIDRVSAIRLLMPPSRANGYEPLVNMDMDMDMDMDMERRRLHRGTTGNDGAKPTLSPSTRRRNRRGQEPDKPALLTLQKPQ